MQITHTQAQKLIQFDLDGALKPEEKNILQIHLKDCMECRTFVEELKGVEHLLVPAMIRHWAVQPAPLLIEDLTNKRELQLPAGMVLATRTALISIVFAAFVLSAWHISHLGNQTANPKPVSGLPIPT